MVNNKINARLCPFFKHNQPHNKHLADKNKDTRNIYLSKSICYPDILYQKIEDMLLWREGVICGKVGQTPHHRLRTTDGLDYQTA